MAASSEAITLGMQMPSFTLPDTLSGETVSSEKLAGKPAVVIFICNHCPYVKRIQEGLAEFGKYCRERGAGLFAISSNDALKYPDDAPERMAEVGKSAGYSFPYLFDASQDVAKAFRAACTPDLYVFDAAGKLAYHGQFDDARPNNTVPATGADARAALEALFAGKAPSPEQKQSIGCSIKWKPGNEPA